MMITVNNKPQPINKPRKVRTTINLDEDVMMKIPYITPNLSEFVRGEINRKYNRVLRRAQEQRQQTA